MGGPRRTVAVDRQALSEAIDIIRAFWAGEPFSFQGSVYSAPDVQPAPRPAHPIGLWLVCAGRGPSRWSAQKADGWSVSAPYVPPERLAGLNGIIDRCAALGGPPRPGRHHPAVQRDGPDLR